MYLPKLFAMPLFHQRPFLCVVMYICLCLTMVQLAPARRWARSLDEDGVENGSVGDEVIQRIVDKGSELFEGDIILTSSQYRAAGYETVEFKRSVDQVGSGEVPILSTASQNDLLQTWPDARVPYAFNQLLDSRWRRTFVEAMDMIEAATCITFVHISATDVDYLLYEFSSSECVSNVGRRGGAQRVTIANGCSSPGHALHEIGHALGMWHEHSRPDRDHYIEIIYSNLESPLYTSYFEVTSHELFKSVPDVEYDIQSVMHYSPYAFASKVGIDKPTIIIKDDADLDELMCTNRLAMGQRKQLSYKDKLRLNLLYRCSANVTNRAVEPPCILPTPTSPLSSELPSTIPPTQMPTPSSTIPFATPTPLSPRLKSGNVISLTIGEGSHGMKCVPSPGCTPLPCDMNACTGVNTAENNQFHIINHESSTKKIRSGATVLLRSVNAPSNWLDCSNTRCIVSTCAEDNEEDPANISYVSSCSSHQFKVFGLGRQLNKLLKVEHKLQFRHKTRPSYLSCNGKRCILLDQGSCQISPVFPVEKVDGNCPIENFSVDKLSEF